MNVHMRKISYYLYQHTRIFKIFYLPHIYIYFLKEYIYICSKYCVKITHVHILSISLPQTTYAHLKYFINTQIFVVSFTLFIHICTSESQSPVTHTLAFEKGTFMPSIYTWGAIPHHIFIWEAFSWHFWHGYIFWKAPYAIYPQICTCWKAFLLLIHTLQGIFMPYTHTLCKAFPRYLYPHIYIPLKGIFHAT